MVVNGGLETRMEALRSCSILFNGKTIDRDEGRYRIRRKKYWADYNVCVKLVSNYIMVCYRNYEILWNYGRFLTFLSS